MLCVSCVVAICVDDGDDVSCAVDDLALCVVVDNVIVVLMLLLFDLIVCWCVVLLLLMLTCGVGDAVVLCR